MHAHASVLIHTQACMHGYAHGSATLPTFAHVQKPRQGTVIAPAVVVKSTSDNIDHRANQVANGFYVRHWGSKTLPQTSQCVKVTEDITL